MEIFQDAINLMLQYLKKIPGVYREDRLKIEMVIRSFIPDFFEAPRCTLPESIVDSDIEEISQDTPNTPPEEPMEIKIEDEEERSGQTSPTGSTRDEGSSDLDESISNMTDNSEESDKSFIEEIDVFDKIDPLPTTNLPYTLFFASKAWYIYFRQFHILCTRLSRLLLESCKMSGEAPRQDPILEDNILETLHIQPTYKQLIEKLSLLLSGVIDYSVFEEQSRHLFGIHAFVSYTMDKLIQSIVRQLQQVVMDDVSKQCTAFFIQSVKDIVDAEITSPIEASQIEHEYLKRVERYMEEERCFKIVWHKKEKTLAVEILEQENEDGIFDPIETEKWSNYLDNYVNDDSCEDDILSESEVPVILPRNLRKMKAYWKRKVAELETSWQDQQSAKVMKRSMMTNKKRRALALLSHPVTKMARRSTVQGESASPTISRPGSVNDSECAIGDTVETKELTPEPTIQKDDTATKESTPELVETATTKEESASESEDDKSDIDEPSGFIATEGNTEDLILVELSKDDEISMQEESVQETVAVDGKADDVPPQSSPEPEEIEKQNEPEKVSSPESFEDEPAAMDVDEDSDDSSNAVKEAKNSQKETEEIDEPSSSVQDTDADLDLDSRVEDAVETAYRILENFVKDKSEDDDAQSDQECEEKDEEATTEEVPPKREIRSVKRVRRNTKTVVPDVPEEDAAASNQECEEKQEEKTTIEEISPRKDSLLKRRIRHKPYDYSVRTRRNRSKQTYMGKRMRKGITRTLQSSKGRRKTNKSVQAKCAEILNDPSFDYAYFSELTDDEKVHYLVHKYLALKDNVEVSLKPGSYKIHFVQGCNLYLHRAKMLTKAREVHQSISEIKTSNFNAWHRVWLDRYVTPSMNKYCHDWMMKSDPEIYKLVRVHISDCKRPPYIPYYKYKIRYYKIDVDSQ